MDITLHVREINNAEFPLVLKRYAANGHKSRILIASRIITFGVIYSLTESNSEFTITTIADIPKLGLSDFNFLATN